MIREDPKPRLSDKKCKKVLLLGSSHGRGLNEQLHWTLGDEYAVTSIFKPNAALGDVVGDLKALTKDLIKYDHVIIVGGPGNIALKGTSSTKLRRTYTTLPKTAGTLMLDLLAFWSDMTGVIWTGGWGVWIWGLSMRFGLRASPTFDWLMYHPWIGMFILGMDCILILETKGSLCNLLLMGLGETRYW
jgi:hypothetical protein